MSSFSYTFMITSHDCENLLNIINIASYNVNFSHDYSKANVLMNSVPSLHKCLLFGKATLINFIILIMESFIAIMNMETMKHLIIEDKVLSLLKDDMRNIWTYV